MLSDESDCGSTYSCIVSISAIAASVLTDRWDINKEMGNPAVLSAGQILLSPLALAVGKRNRNTGTLLSIYLMHRIFACSLGAGKILCLILALGVEKQNVNMTTWLTALLQTVVMQRKRLVDDVENVNILCIKTWRTMCDSVTVLVFRFRFPTKEPKSDATLSLHLNCRFTKN